MKNLEHLDSKVLIDEIGRRFLERETTISAMHIMMTKMEEMNKKLLKAEENKSKFMSIIKNEFNNPLASMLSLSKSLLTSSEDEKVTFIGKTIQEEALLLSFQIKNIITAAEIESGTLDLQLSKANFQELISRIKEDLAYPISNKQAQLKINILNNTSFHYDKEKVYLILINLISNAIEFSSQNSIIEIDILDEINNFKIIVKDYGEGIEEIDKDKIYQRFHQAHSGMNRVHRGQGLGLSVIKDLVVFMNGEIKFDSKLDDYTIFEINLSKIPSEDALFDDEFMFSDFEGSEF